MPFLGAERLTAQVFTCYLLNLPDGIPVAGIERGLIECEGKWGLTNPGSERNLVWPWAECQAATVLAYMHDQRAYEHLNRAAQITSQLGAFPEKVRPDCFWIGFYYTTCCGAFAWAVNSMLAHSRGDTLSILPAAPVDWADVAFTNLRVAPGLLVSAEARHGALAHLAVTNDSPAPISSKLDVPPRWLGTNALPEILSLAPGETWTI